jgi:hypothetical protein
MTSETFQNIQEQNTLLHTYDVFENKIHRKIFGLQRQKADNEAIK